MCTINTHINVIVMINKQFKHFISLFKQNLGQEWELPLVCVCVCVCVCAHNIFVTNQVLHILKNI